METWAGEADETFDVPDGRPVECEASEAILDHVHRSELKYILRLFYLASVYCEWHIPSFYKQQGKQQDFVDLVYFWPKNFGN